MTTGIAQNILPIQENTRTHGDDMKHTGWIELVKGRLCVIRGEGGR
jgi:hypothetical protein